MTYENNAQHDFTANRHEFRARLPWIDKISSGVLEGRVQLGVRKTLDAVTALSSSVAGGEPLREIISACNFSTSQCVKEIKRRGIKVKV